MGTNAGNLKGCSMDLLTLLCAGLPIFAGAALGIVIIAGGLIVVYVEWYFEERIISFFKRSAVWLCGSNWRLSLILATVLFATGVGYGVVYPFM
jgi:hypothetical protein